MSISLRTYGIREPLLFSSRVMAQHKPNLPQKIRQVKSEQQDWAERFGIFLHRRRVEILREMLSNERYSTALDIGCGDGLLVAVGLTYAIGIDVRSGKGVTVLASAENLPFRSECFDLVFAGEVIEHLDHPLQALKDWTQVLKPRGTMVISTPNGLLVTPWWNPEHKKTYAPQSLRAGLQKLGLQIINVKGIFTGLVSGKRLFEWVLFEKMKMFLLRLPVPISLSYDLFIKARKGN